MAHRLSIKHSGAVYHDLSFWASSRFVATFFATLPASDGVLMASDRGGGGEEKEKKDEEEEKEEKEEERRSLLTTCLPLSSTFQKLADLPQVQVPWFCHHTKKYVHVMCLVTYSGVDHV